jgi:hypothetical protein
MEEICMRPQAQIKMGFYPTPLSVMARLTRHLSFYSGEPYSALDPCCGDGAALAALCPSSAALHRCGIEPDHERAKRAGSLVDQVVHAPLEQVDLPEQGFSILFLNPPYGDETDESAPMRSELSFLRATLPALSEGGVLIYIIPKARFSEPVCRTLSEYCEGIRIFRFPDPEYGRFRQLVLLAYRSGERPAADRTPWEEIQRTASGTLDVLDPDPIDPLSPTTCPKVALSARAHTDDELERLLLGSPLQERIARLVEIEAAHGQGIIRSPLPLRRGHVGLMLAAGRLRGLIGNGGSRHLVVGKPVRTKERVEEVDEDGNQIIREKHSFKVVIKVLTPEGKIRLLE